ncbi:MAG: hypothetical protein GY765_01015 [bacterium]|nr:hypothetical protein [bacterium]
MPNTENVFQNQKDFLSNFFGDSIVARLEKLSALFADIPADTIFEFELNGSPGESPDISLCLMQSSVKDILPHWEKAAAAFERDAYWKKIITFCNAWADASLPLHNGIANVWFEFDSDKLERHLPAPCVFISPTTLFKSKQQAQLPNYDWIFEPTLALLTAKMISDAQMENIRRCMDTLPFGGVVFQIGVMMARETEQLRICTSMPPAEYPSYLERIGWKGNVEAAKSMLHQLEKHVDAVFVDLNVGEFIEPTLAFECCYQGVAIGKRLEGFLGFLQEKKICRSEQTDRLMYGLQDPGPETSGRILRKALSHVKLGLRLDNTWQAKAYLSLRRV